VCVFAFVSVSVSVSVYVLVLCVAVCNFSYVRFVCSTQRSVSCGMSRPVFIFSGRWDVESNKVQFTKVYESFAATEGFVFASIHSLSFSLSVEYDGELYQDEDDGAWMIKGFVCCAVDGYLSVCVACVVCVSVCSLLCRTE